MPSSLQDQCAAMAARMLDGELLAILRKLDDNEPQTPLQQAVIREAGKRDLTTIAFTVPAARKSAFSHHSELP